MNMSSTIYHKIDSMIPLNEVEDFLLQAITTSPIAPSAGLHEFATTQKQSLLVRLQKIFHEKENSGLVLISEREFRLNQALGRGIEVWVPFERCDANTFRAKSVDTNAFAELGDEIRGVIGLDFRYKKAHAYKRDCRITGGFDGKASDIEETSVDTQRIYTDIDNALDTADTIISCYQRSSDNDKPSPIAVGTYYCEDDESMTARNYSPQRDFYGSEVVTSRPPPPRTNMFTYGEASNVTSETPTRSGAVSDFVSSVGIATIPTAGTDRLNLSDMFHNSSGTTKRGRK